MGVNKLIRHNDDMFLVIREFALSYLTNKDGTTKNKPFNLWKEYLEADMVLKNQTHFMFCQKIVEPEWEDIKEEV
jgi:hypothetical protein